MTQSSTSGERPVVIVGAGPVGLVTALGLIHYGIPVVLLEEDKSLSLDTKAGTILTRTLEVLDRYDAVQPVLADALRLDEIGELDRASGQATMSVRMGTLTDDTRFPFVINMPQNLLEAALERHLGQIAPGVLHLGHRVESFEQSEDAVRLHVRGPDGEYEIEADRLLACDGGRSRTRDSLGIKVEGKTLEDRYMLVDLKVDLDVANPRDYPYLSYFADAKEWMILVRQPHCWRFLYPLKPGMPEPTPADLRDKAIHFIGDVSDVDIIGTNVYTVHQLVARTWQVGRVFLMGDAAHLLTPMWALGLNTGVLDASNLPWRLAWVARGWADPGLLSGYESEQQPVAIEGSGQMAEAARASMDQLDGLPRAMTAEGTWGNAFTRALLGVRLDVGNTGDWSMVKMGASPTPVLVGDRMPNLVLFGPDGLETRVHDLVKDSFVAMHFTDGRRRPNVPRTASPGLRHVLVSRWDAPLDSGLRGVSYFDPSDRLRTRLGNSNDVSVLIRPDAHVAALVPWDGDGTTLDSIYEAIVHPTSSKESAHVG